MILAAVALLLVAAMRPRRTTMSHFELTRRSDKGDDIAKRLLRRETLLGDVLSLQRMMIALFLVVFTALSVTVFGWVLGVIVALVAGLEYGMVARLSFLQQTAHTIYEKIEPRILEWIERYPKIFGLIRSITIEKGQDYQLESREQLLHLVAQAGNMLSVDEKRLIKHGLGFEGQLVSTVMTPSSMIDTIKHKELLGPLVLDDLHKTGHSRFPVVDEDINHVVGILHIRDLLSVHGGKGSTTVEKSMEPKVLYIHEDQALAHALAAFLRTHRHLFIVVNEFRETVGLLTLEDVIEALLGRKIVDEFDAHDDLRAVAARNPRGNNHPPKHTDV